LSTNNYPLSTIKWATGGKTGDEGLEKMLVMSQESRIKSRNRREARGARSEKFSSFPSPQPLAPSPRARSGLSLTEVLIAMGILTLGLLGVASVFPVGSYYMLKADVSDRGSAIAQSVMSDLMARGMLNPRS